MKTETDLVAVAVTNSCVCVAVDGEGNEVLDENGDFVPNEYCWGCFDDMKSDLEAMILDEWITPETAGIYMSSKAMNWDRRSGFALAEPDTDAVIRALSINGDWRIVFKLIGDDLLAVRYSHDEPTGASFAFARLSEAQVEEYRENGYNFVE